MDKVSEIVIKSKQIKEGIFTGLEFDISGKNINYIIVNTLRRVAMTDVPIYIFNKINFTKNTSVYHNDYLTLRIRNISVKIPNDNVFFENKKEHVEQVKSYEEKMLDENVKYAMGEDDIEMIDTNYIDETLFKEVTMYLKYHNTDNKIVHVTTNDCKFYQNGKEYKNPFDRPVIIVDLQPGQRIELSAITELGTEKQSAIFSPVSRFAFVQKSDEQFTVKFYSSGQLTEKRIMYVVCQNIKKQLNDFLELVPDVDDMENKIEIHDIDHTLGNLISIGMIKHKYVDYCSYNMPHYLDDKVHIKYKLNKGKLKSIIENVVKYYVEIFDKIEDHFSK